MTLLVFLSLHSILGIIYNKKMWKWRPELFVFIVMAEIFVYSYLYAKPFSHVLQDGRKVIVTLNEKNEKDGWGGFKYRLYFQKEISNVAEVEASNFGNNISQLTHVSSI